VPLGFSPTNYVTGAELERCPLRTMQLIEQRDPALYREYQRMLGFYEDYKNGILPQPGGMAHQHARFVAWMRAIAQSDAATQKAFMKRDEVARAEQARVLQESREEDAEWQRQHRQREQEE
jgi:hypothetical protein